MWIKRISAGAVVAAAGVILMASMAVAESSFDDGDYTLVLPGVGAFEFTIDATAVGGDTVVAVAAPEDYAIDDEDPDKAAWKDAASLEVEAKVDKVEGDVDWAEGEAKLMLPNGGSITVTPPDADGNFDVTVSGDWWAFGSGSDWIVANAEDIETATRFFTVEATDDGIEIKAIDGPGEGFLRDLDDEEDEEEPDEDESDEDESDEDKDKDEGAGNNGRGRGNGEDDSE